MSVWSADAAASAANSLDTQIREKRGSYETENEI
jgi:hypothetical protein